MKKILLLLFFVATCFAYKASGQIRTPQKFDVAVSFGSMATGPSSDIFLKSFITKFVKKNTVKIKGYKAAGCGREGEFNILFSTTGMKSSTKKKFIAELERTVTAQEKKNKAKDEHSGNIVVELNKTKSDFEHCREGIALWK